MFLNLDRFWMNAKDVATIILKTLRWSLIGGKRMVAHTLAREALFLAGPEVFNDVPLCILTLINNEKL